MDSLFVIQGNEQGMRRALDDDVVTLGRDCSNKIQLHDAEASRRHARITRVDDARQIVDLESSNGVFVNGERVKSRLLINGDQIQIGKTILLFVSRKTDVGAKEPLVEVLQDSDLRGESQEVPIAPDASGNIFENAEDAAAIKSAWLKKARAHLDFLYHATLASSRTLEVESLLRLFLELIFQWAPVDRGCIFLYDDESDKLVPKASKTRAKGRRVEVSQALLDYASRNRKGVLTRVADRKDSDRRPSGVIQKGFQEAICVPMQGRYGLVGVIYLDVARNLGAAEYESEGDRAPSPSDPNRSEKSGNFSGSGEFGDAANFGGADDFGDSDDFGDAAATPDGAQDVGTDDAAEKPASDKPPQPSEIVVVPNFYGAKKTKRDDATASDSASAAKSDDTLARFSLPVGSPLLADPTSDDSDASKYAKSPSVNSSDSTWARRTKRLTLDHLKMMVAFGYQAALAVEDTQFYLGMAQAERLAVIGQTVAVLSHHIKNILQGIRGGSYLIGAGINERDVDLVSKGWTIVEKNQTKISDLVLDMLTFSKERTPVWSFANFCETVADAVELASGRADDLDVELVFRPDPSTPKFYFDKEQIHRAFVNLIANALEASKDYDPETNASGDGPKFPRARVETSVRYDAETKRVFFFVDDVGPGVPPEMRETIFRPFTSKNKSGGTGLGLAVTHKIVVEHKGTISVETSPLGGARFVVALPLALEKKEEIDDAAFEECQPAGC